MSKVVALFIFYLLDEDANNPGIKHLHINKDVRKHHSFFILFLIFSYLWQDFHSFSGLSAKFPHSNPSPPPPKDLAHVQDPNLRFFVLCLFLLICKYCPMCTSIFVPFLVLLIFITLCTSPVVLYLSSTCTRLWRSCDAECTSLHLSVTADSASNFTTPLFLCLLYQQELSLPFLSPIFLSALVLRPVSVFLHVSSRVFPFVLTFFVQISIVIFSLF